MIIMGMGKHYKIQLSYPIVKQIWHIHPGTYIISPLTGTSRINHKGMPIGSYYKSRIPLPHIP
jgi:hypothetical protein